MTNTRKGNNSLKKVTKSSSNAVTKNVYRQSKDSKGLNDDLKNESLSVKNNSNSKDSFKQVVTPPSSPKKRATVNYADRESNDYQIFTPQVSLLCSFCTYVS